MGKNVLTILILMFCLGNICAQDMLGTWGSNYGGVSSTFQNPAFIANSKLYMDINLVGAGFSYYHNDSYLEASDSYVYELLHNKIGFPKPTLAKTNYYLNNRPDFVKAYISARELGPSFMLNDGKNAYAFSLSTRQSLNVSQVSDGLANLTKSGVINPLIASSKGYNVTQPIYAAGLAWGEAAFTYARVLKSDDQDVITLGATLKYLMGAGGGYLYIDNIELGLKNRSTFTINNSKMGAGFSLPYDYTKPKGSVVLDPLHNVGKGFGTDLGFSIQHNSRLHNIQRYSRYCEQEFEQYDYRFAVSLIDFGYIKFKNRIASGVFENSTPIDYNIRNFVFNSTQGAIDSLNSLYSIPKPKNDNFNILLPTAISFQYDKRMTDNIYVTAGGIIGIPLGKNALRRPSQLAIIPRYESDIFEVSLPLSMYDFSKPRLGISTRIFFLTLGTDRLISLGGVRDYYGYDFYATIRLNFMKFFRLQFIKGQCWESQTHPCF